jgi:hypothetical protein
VHDVAIEFATIDWPPLSPPYSRQNLGLLIILNYLLMFELQDAV